MLIINNRKIGIGHSVYFIADIAANHDGDLNRAKELISLAAEAGADAAKFQHFQAETIVSDYGFKSLGNQQSHQSNWRKSVYEVYEDASLNLEWTEELVETCCASGITFFTSPYSLELVDYIDPFVPAYKIGSGDITWTSIIEHIAKKNKPYILATGASTTDDVKRAVAAGLAHNNQLALLQCNTNYTGSLENLRYVNLNVLKTYQAMFPGMILGLSDHTPGHSTVLGAVAIGACIIEKHFTDDMSREGPDHAFSMDPGAWREMVLRTRELEAALGSGVKRIEFNEQQTAVLQRRCIRLHHDLSAGDVIALEDINVLRPAPAGSIPPYQSSNVIGRKLRVSKKAGEHLTYNDYE